MSNQENRPHTHCLNCGTELNGDYCHNCGQQDTDPNSIKDMIMVYLDNAFMWDPKILRTIWQLVRRPGYLTTAFTSGKVASVALVEDGKFIDTIEKNTNLSHSQAVLPVCVTAEIVSTTMICAKFSRKSSTATC